jgi:glycosyltransferase involved in cell wall biosynthesis
LISILLPNLIGGGAERVSLDLAYAFAKLGYEVEFVLMQAKGDFLSEARQSFKINELGVHKVRSIPRKLASYLCSRKPTVLIANMWPLTTAAVVGRVLSSHKCMLILVEHCTLTNQYAGQGKLHNLLMQLSIYITYGFASHIVAVSSGVAANTAQLACLNSERVKVLYNPIPIRTFTSSRVPSEANNIWNCTKGLRILTVGSIKDQKNHRLLLKAFAQIDQLNARLMIVGKGDNEESLKKLALELGILDRVIFAGFHSDPTPFYASADLFVLSSDYEGLPTVLIEALNFGLHIVSTDCPSGPSEILENGRWGRLVPIGDVTALANAMGEGLFIKPDRHALRKRGAEFSPEIAARKYLALIEGNK